MHKITHPNTGKGFTRTLEASSVSSQSERGFTLIELLVVIAIIGILSVIVLAALGGARSNAKEASILSTLRQAQTQAELHNLSVGSYAGLCQDEKIQGIVTSASSTGDGAACYVHTNHSGELLTIDYGIGIRHNDNYYAVSPQGVVTFDEENSGDTNWNSAKQICTDENKRLPTPSELKTTYNIGNTTPEGFPSDYYWSNIESPSDSTLAYRTALYGNNSVTRTVKSNNLSVRCVE